MARKEEVSWMDALRETASSSKPTSAKAAAPTKAAALPKAASAPTLATITPKAEAPKLTTSVSERDRDKITKTQTEAPTKPSEPLKSSSGSSPANTVGASAGESWMAALASTKEDASMNWMEALRTPIAAPAAPAEETQSGGLKVTQFLLQTVGRTGNAFKTKKEDRDLSHFFGMEPKRKGDEDEATDPVDKDSAPRAGRSRSTSEIKRTGKVQAVATPIPVAPPEPQEIREEGAILVMENNQFVLRAATIEKLVESLTSEAKADLPFTNTFMLTFRDFITPLGFFQLLMKRFDQPMPPNLSPQDAEQWKSRVLTSIRLRVFIVIRIWVAFHWTDFENPELLASVRDFTRKMREAGLANASEALSKLLEKKQSAPVTGPTWGGGNEFSVLQPPPPPRPLITKEEWGTTKPPFMTLPPEEMARQLTLLEHELFRVIPPTELLGISWMKPDKAVRAPNVIANIARFNQVSQWVTCEVVSASNLRACQAAIEYFIRLMEECFALQNYCSTLEIVSGLEQTPVWRLKEVWAAVNPKLRKSLEQKAKKFRSDKNWKKHRKLVKQAIPPCIPYLGMYLTDLVFADEAPREREPRYINFDRYRRLASIVYELQVHQRALYNLEPLPFMRSWLTQLKHVDEQTLFQRSYALLPRGGTKRADVQVSQSLALRRSSISSGAPPLASPHRQPTTAPMPQMTFMKLRNSFPEMVKETLLAAFPPEKYGFCSWRADDVHGIVYGWADEVELYVAQSDTDTVIIYAAMHATKSDICTTERQVKLYGLSANDQRFVHASIITLACAPDVVALAEEKGIAVIIVKDVPLQETSDPQLSPPLVLDTLAAPARPKSVEEESAPVGARPFVRFFEACGLLEESAHYCAVFSAQKIELEDLRYLSMDHLTEIGVKMGHGLKMMKVIQQYQTQAPPM